MPADYYSAPLAEVRPVFPPWVAWGCGGLAALFLVVLFIGGAWMASGGLPMLVDFTFGQSIGQMRGMYAPDVTEQEKKTLEDEIDVLRKGIREEKIAVARLQPVLLALQDAVSDKKVDRSDVEKLRMTVRAAQTPAAK